MCVSGRCVAFLTCAALLLLNNCHVVTGASLAANTAYAACLADPATCTSLSQTSGDLTGTIPTRIGELTKLTNLELYSNSLDGTIPTEVGLLTELEELDLEGNKLTGTIPTEIGKLTKLEELELYSNSLDGTIPTEIGKLTDLKELELDQNNLDGTIPTEIGLLTDLTELELYTNNLTGTIPTEIGLLTDLTELYLEQNKLSGSVPFEIFTKLTALSDVKLHGNAGLCGEFPSNFNKTETGFRVLLATDKVDEYDFDEKWKKGTRVGFACPDSSGNRSSMDVTALAMMALVAFITAHVVVY